jgi:hypothetical protein
MLEGGGGESVGMLHMSTGEAGGDGEGQENHEGNAEGSDFHEDLLSVWLMIK